MRDPAARAASRAASRANGLVARTALVAALALPAVVPSGARAQLPEWQARLVRDARARTYGAEQRPVPDAGVDRPWPVPGLPDVTFAPVSGRRSASGVAGRITSRTAYPRLGIPAGVSYLWVATQPTVRMAIVPTEAGRAGTWLPATRHPGSRASDPCRIQPFMTQLGSQRSSSGGGYLLAACTCVNGVWMHTEGAGAELLTAVHARLLLPR